VAVVAVVATIQMLLGKVAQAAVGEALEMP
jgi:hypothetical protein